MDQQTHKELEEHSRKQSATGKKKQDQLIGTRVDGRYEILSVIGYGATTSVYKAQDTQRNRLVAIKMLHTHSTASDMTVRRFEQECKTLALLKHANIVAQYDNGVTDQDQPFLVMEFLEGLTLKQMIDDNGVIPVIEALSIFIQACAGLATAHEKGIVHRDMKPANIMVVKDELEKIGSKY
jgi:serine/threonine-protein kinase